MSRVICEKYIQTELFINKSTARFDEIHQASGYVVKSASFEFADLPMEKQGRLPNLLEWFDPTWKGAVAKWLEEEVHLSFFQDGFLFLPGIPCAGNHKE